MAEAVAALPAASAAKGRDFSSFTDSTISLSSSPRAVAVTDFSGSLFPLLPLWAESPPFLTPRLPRTPLLSIAQPTCDQKGNSHWVVTVEAPPLWSCPSKRRVVDYYASVLPRVLGSEGGAQARLNKASCEVPFGFCCYIDEETAQELDGVPGVLSVRPDPAYISIQEDYVSIRQLESNPLFSTGSTKKWLVRMSKRAIGVVTKKAQMVDYYAKILVRVLGNEKVAQMDVHLSQKTLRAAFEGYGELVEVKVIMDKISKRTKGYAFVECKTEEAASVALKEMNG